MAKYEVELLAYVNIKTFLNIEAKSKIEAADQAIRLLEQPQSDKNFIYEFYGIKTIKVTPV